VATVGGDLAPYRPTLRRLLNHAVEHGLDRQYGGVFRDGLRSTGEPIVYEKEFWQHAECLVGFLDGWEEFRDERYREAFGNVWEFVRRWFIVAGVGEWRTLLARDGTPLDANIGDPWKVSYHTGRAMLETCLRLERRVAARNGDDVANQNHHRR
jgi:mannobiose 2-epimerase